MIGKVLKRLRNIYGYTAAELSNELSISKSHLSEIENGNKEPSLELLGRYSKLMDIRQSSLMLFAEEYQEAETNNKVDDFIRKLMGGVIEALAKGT
jgi:transcriptional regulator with XRE-family HTH domain